MNMRAFVTRFGVLLFVVLAWSLAGAQEIGIAAASDLQFVFKDIADRFEKQTGHTLRLSFGSSGNFYSQIQNGAPFDLFFSADMEYPQKLEAEGLAEPGSIYQYARGKIVLWVSNDSPLDVRQGLSVLLDSRVHKIAIANPAHAPYGRAAVAALKSAGIYDKITDKLVYGENISQAAHFVASGNADAGILALSTALSPMIGPRGKYFLVPLDSYPPLDQAVVIMKSSDKKQEAKCFLQFIQNQEIVDLLRQYGFELPAPPVNKVQSCACCRRPVVKP
jgi:molybdate transport system substrate-binding protein